MKCNAAAFPTDPARSVWLDSAKGLLILFVIWGHLIEKAASQSPAIAGIYGAIYLFHMPAFALISGMLSAAVINANSLYAIARKLLLPLLVFQLLYRSVFAHLTPYGVSDILTPQWILWFLLSLAMWKVMLPVFLRSASPVLLSLVVAVTVGYFDAIGYTLSLSRTFVFFPAFLFGHVYRDQIKAFAARPGARSVALFAVLSGTAGLLIAQGASIAPLWGSLPYDTQASTLMPALFRLVTILAGIAAAVAFLSLIPPRSALLSDLGRHSLTIYLLHGFMVLAFWAITPFGAAPNALVFLLLTAILALLIATCLAALSRAMATTGPSPRSAR